ncbi:hypothetical protein LOK49_LG12G02632 [Camellia lanceoleosa]|uniref:Uncharacterized protein n=1 Tax=Camellia lanceoleosa TaxID=1840588 RepID=A0ACC0FT69_9ERIC|nr:hypothetical protein LOK49_LG12G02632 [Camellia lanceoleosa]
MALLGRISAGLSIMSQVYYCTRMWWCGSAMDLLLLLSSAVCGWAGALPLADVSDLTKVQVSSIVGIQNWQQGCSDGKGSSMHYNLVFSFWFKAEYNKAETSKPAVYSNPTLASSGYALAGFYLCHITGFIKPIPNLLRSVTLRWIVRFDSTL